MLGANRPLSLAYPVGSTHDYWRERRGSVTGLTWTNGNRPAWR